MFAMDPVLSWTFSADAAAIFALSATLKLRDLDLFEAAVRDYWILPSWAVKPFSRCAPVMELAAAAGIAFPWSRGWAGAVLVGLLCVFSAAIAINLLRGRRELECGCCGAAMRQHLSGLLLWRNGGLALLVGLAMGPVNARPVGALDLFIIMAGGASLMLLYASANYLIAATPAPVNTQNG